MFGRGPALSTPYCSGPAPCKPRSIYRTNYIFRPDRIQSGPVIRMEGTTEKIERGCHLFSVLASGRGVTRQRRANRMSFCHTGTTHHTTILTTEEQACLPRPVHGSPTSSNY